MSKHSRFGYSSTLNSIQSKKIIRRDICSGFVSINNALKPPTLSAEEKQSRWQSNQPIYLPSICKNSLQDYQVPLSTSRSLYEAALADKPIDDILDKSPYIDQLGQRFQLLSSRVDAADPQEIVSLDFDVMDGEELLYEDIWIRISWLSFHESDASLRFRFSFGMENYDDVSSDPERQVEAAELCQAIFPESSILSHNEEIQKEVQSIAGLEKFRFVERIVYFNAPNGGAQFHHDAEKGHAGVCYVQLTGETFWLSLSLSELINEVIEFLNERENFDNVTDLFGETIKNECQRYVESPAILSNAIKDPYNENIGLILNECPLFFKHLVERNYAYHLKPGDGILLPQESIDQCAWHSVFSFSEEAGEALSFAIKKT